MRNLNELQVWRRWDCELRAHGVVGDEGAGVFVFEREGVDLYCVMSSGEGWDHISISTRDRTPTWDEMEFVRKRVTKPGEVWMQFGVPDSLHINVHPYVLHWWRPQHREVRLPPRWMV